MSSRHGDPFSDEGEINQATDTPEEEQDVTGQLMKCEDEAFKPIMFQYDGGSQTLPHIKEEPCCYDMDLQHGTNNHLIKDEPLNSDWSTHSHCQPDAIKKVLLSDGAYSAPPPRSYPCPVCKRTFVSFGFLAKHRDIHSGKKMSCVECGADFCTKADLVAHAKQHNGKSRLSLEVQMQFQSVLVKDELLPHEEESLQHSALPSYANNDLMNEELPRDYEMGAPPGHVAVKQEPGSSDEDEDDAPPLMRPAYSFAGDNMKISYACPVCKRTFSNHANLSRHRETHSGKTMSCKLCGANFCNKTDLAAHTKEHRASRVSQARAACKRTFSDHSNLIGHRKTHSKTISCLDCGADFCTKADLAAHAKQHNGKSGPSLQVQMQLESVWVKDELLSDKEESLQLSAASSFADNDLIKEEPPEDYEIGAPPGHVQFQTVAVKLEASSGDEDEDDAPSPMGTANRFAGDNMKDQADSLMAKMSYTCPVCKRTFSNHANLSRHRETHSGKTMSCKECRADFCNKTDLAAHAKEHRASRVSHARAVCKRTFNDHSNFIGHRETHSEMISCLECGADFCTMVDLAAHAKQHSGKRGPSLEVQMQLESVWVKNELLSHEEESPQHSAASSYANNDLMKAESPEDYEMGAPPGHIQYQTVAVKLEASSSDEDEDNAPSPMRTSYSFPGDNMKDQADSLMTKMSYACPVCKRTFSNHGNLSRHRETHKGVRMSCKLCGADFCNKTDLAAHAKEHRASRVSHSSSLASHACPVCKRTFNTHADLIRHRETHKGKTMSCKECGADFCNKTDLAAHSRTHRGSGGPYRTPNVTYSCPVCKRTFNSPGNLIKHSESQKGARVSCLQCGADFCNKTDLAAHTRKHRVAKVFPCIECDKTFPSLSHLAVHKSAHAGGKSLTCAHCGKQFSEESSLMEHLQVHAVCEEFFCDICDKSYPREEDLVSHQRSHEEEVAIICSECGLTFVDQDTLDRHLRLHKLHKPFFCGLCGKQFVHQTELVRHERTHVN